MESILPLLIPLFAISIPLALVVGKTIVQPLARAIASADGKKDEAFQAAVSARLTEIDSRIEAIEDAMQRVLETESFYRTLAAGRSPADTLPPTLSPDQSGDTHG